MAYKSWTFTTSIGSTNTNENHVDYINEGSVVGSEDYILSGQSGTIDLVLKVNGTQNQTNWKACTTVEMVLMSAPAAYPRLSKYQQKRVVSEKITTRNTTDGGGSCTLTAENASVLHAGNNLYIGAVGYDSTGKVVRTTNMQYACTIEQGASVEELTDGAQASITALDALKEQVANKLNASGYADHLAEIPVVTAAGNLKVRPIEFAIDSNDNFVLRGTESQVIASIPKSQLDSNSQKIEFISNRIDQNYNPALITVKSDVNVGQTPFADDCIYDLCGHTMTIEKAIGNNLSLKNGKIVLPSKYRFADVHGSFTLENIVIESDFWSAHNIYCDDIKITNCKFTNVALGFPDSKQVYINNNRFICTVDNSASTVGSEEFIHINPSLPLDACVISNNYFYGSKNDCIDCFPAGFVTKIIGNTFDECSDTIIELKSHYRDYGHTDGSTEQSIDGIIISANVFKNIKRRTVDTVCINIYATDERTEITDKDFSFYPKVTISNCIFDNSNNENFVCVRMAAEEGTVLISNCRTFAKNAHDNDDANGTFVKGGSSCTVYISNCYTVTKNFLDKETSAVGVMTARVSNCYGRYIQARVDNIYMSNVKIYRIFSKKGNIQILTNCELTDNYTPNSNAALVGCFVKNILSPSVTDGINVKITNSFYTGSISNNSLIESVGNVKII